jgi:RNA polymerase sigma-70 factor (ECF subfamily)
MAESPEIIQQQLLSLIAQHELEAAATLVIRSFGPELLRYLQTLVGSEADAREAFSQFAENLWRGIGQFRGESLVRTWAYRLAFHAATRIQRDPFRRRAEPISGVSAELMQAITSVSSRARRTHMEQTLERLRAELDDEEKTLLVLRVDRELSWGEIAAVLSGAGEPVGEAALRKRYERLKTKIRTLARKEGVLP